MTDEGIQPLLRNFSPSQTIVNIFDVVDVMNKHHKNRNLHTHKKVPHSMSIENVVDKAIQSYLRRIIWKNTIEPCHSPA